MSAPLIYNVLTEFRFEVGSALLGSQQLAGAVDQISSAADNALFSFKKLGFGIVASMGLGAGGLLGALGTALQVSDKFAQSQRDLANIITSNSDGTVSWNQALNSASNTMGIINKKAAEFSLPTTDLLSMTKQIGAVLLSHGLDTTGLGKSVDLSRQFLKSAPTLGVNPQDSQQQLVRAILGNASGNDTLFNRLTGETSAMKKFGTKGGTQAFNVLPASQRLDLLTKGLAQFSSNLNYVHGNALSLSGELRRMGELIKGPFSILKDLGDVLMKPVLTVLHGVNSYIANQGASIIKSFAGFLKKSLEEPKSIIAGLFQMRALKQDVKTTGSIFGIVGGLSALNHVASLLGFRIPLLAAAFEKFAIFSAMLGPQASGLFGGLFAGLTKIFVPLGLLIGMLQLVSRAIGYARIADAENFANILPQFAKIMELLKFVFQPFLDFFDATAKFISPIFQLSFYMNALVVTLDVLAKALLLARATFQGFIFAIMETFNQLTSFFTGGGFDFSAIGNSFNAGIDQLLQEALGAIDTGEGIVNQVTNIGKVEIKNQFKENMEPDRIAFSLTKQLAKVAQNPTQARGKQFAPVGG